MACDNNTPPNQADQPLYIHQGADFNAAFTYQDPDGVAINITGYEFVMTMVERKAGGDAAATWTSADGDFAITSAASGTFTLTVPAAETAELVPGTYFYDLNALVPGGAINPLMQGPIIVDQEA
jgi:hypothetical protein